MIDASETLDNGEVLQVPFSPIKDRNKKFFDTGRTIRNGVTVSGGDDVSDFLLSVDHTNVEGIVPRDRYNRTNMRLKASRTYGKLEVGGNLSFFRQHSNTVSNSAGRQGRPVYWNVINTPLHIDLSDPMWKNWRTGKFTRNEVSYYRFYENPYFIIDTQREKNDLYEFNILANAKYKFTDWLDISTIVGYTGSTSRFKREFGAFTYDFHLQNTYSEIDEYGASTADNIGNSERFNSDVLLTFDKSLTDDFTAKLIVGNNLRITNSKSVNVSGTNLIIPDFYNVSTRTGELNGGESSTQFRRIGLYGDLTLGFRDYLFLNVTGRNDWSSTLIKDQRSFFYPSAGLSFVATDAFPVLKGDNGLSYLKANVSYTKTGNDPLVYANQNVFSAPGNFPYGSTAGLTLSNIERDRFLKPEFTTSYEAGVQMSFFKSRLNIDATVYKTNSTDQIIPINTSFASGASQAYINVGEVQNKGIELDLNGTILRNENFSWNLGVNYSGFDSEVLSLIEGVDEVEIGGYADAQIVARVGEPFPLIRTSSYLRDPQGRVIVGDDGDPIRDSNNQTQGKTSPDYIVGLNTTIRYKNLSLYAVADYRTGHVFFNDIVNALEFTGLTKHSASSGRQPFVFPNSSYSDGNGGYTANTNRLTSGGGNAFWDAYNDVKENYVTDATTLKIREIALNYDLSTNMLDAIGVERFTVGLYGRNLLTFRPKDNVYTDPEFNFTTGNAIGVGTQSQTPPTRNYGLSLSVTF